MYRVCRILLILAKNEYFVKFLQKLPKVSEVVSHLKSTFSFPWEHLLIVLLVQGDLLVLGLISLLLSKRV